MSSGTLSWSTSPTITIASVDLPSVRMPIWTGSSVGRAVSAPFGSAFGFSFTAMWSPDDEPGSWRTNSSLDHTLRGTLSVDGWTKGVDHGDSDEVSVVGGPG